MNKILGLDLGTTSIGWALVNEAENENETSSIIKLGVRVNPLTVDEQTNFEKGRPLTTNADRTLKRTARRNLQRFKLRRKNLIEILLKYNIISERTQLTEIGKHSTHQTLFLRAKAAKEKIELEEFARVLLAINKKRGYKSSRKAKNEEEGNAIDGMKIAKELYDSNLTIGKYVHQILLSGKKYIPDFYRSDLQKEFDLVWETQKQFYPEILDDELYTKIQNQGQQNTRKRFLAIKGIYTAENKGKREETKLQHYKWRSEAISKQLTIEEVAYVLVEINNNLNKSSGYLGAISDRSKELYFNKETVGENQYQHIKANKHNSLKNQVFYRQDYLDEFETIWETQSKYYDILNDELKKEIRDVVIFYQRKLKSQKHLISECQFEKQHKAIPKSSPLFQEFKVWASLNILEFQNKATKEKIKFIDLDDEIRNEIFEECNTPINTKLDVSAKPEFILNLLNKYFKLGKKSDWKGNLSKIEINRLNKQLYSVYHKIAEEAGYGFDWDKKSVTEINQELQLVFKEIGIEAELLNFNANILGNDFDKQSSYQLWHLLYAVEEEVKINQHDKITYGNSDVSLKRKLHLKYGFEPKYASLLANISLPDDYGNLSAKAIKKIIPYLESGNVYSEASRLAGYNHSNSLTKEELDNRILKDKLDLLPKNSLRNPVVEKILNQMVNLINQIIDEYGKPDEIRIELARELKKSAQERADTTKFINDATSRNDEIRKILRNDPVYNIKNPTRNDVIKYKLYQELKNNGYKTFFTNKEIPPHKLFSKEIDIEHIIPKAKLFDDSFSNKTLAYRQVNLEKADTLAYDFISDRYNSDLEKYKSRIESAFEDGLISKGKYKKLLLSEKNIPEDFIERDLRNSQYIAKKAKNMLMEVFVKVTPTIGRITDKLREDWDLINVMKELNLPKYRGLGLTKKEERKNGKFIEQIVDWTKRNDHRHHAMDALAVAFTTESHIQYLNNINASRNDTLSEKFKKKYNQDISLNGIRDKITKVYKNKNRKGKRKFIPPSENFRIEAKNELEKVLISFKAKNKVVTLNKNKTKLKGKDKFHIKAQLTPRGQLHKETVYGKLNEEVVKLEKVNAKFTKEKILEVTKHSYREALLKRLQEFENNPKKAFAGKNSLSKNPVFTFDGKKVPETVKTKSFEDNYTIRKEITPENFKTPKLIQKVIDIGVRKVLVERLAKYQGNAKKAFSDLDKYPIWLNEEKGISIKRVKISGVKNAENLHIKKDHLGNDILDKNGKKIKSDFVSTGNNHHLAIYMDKEGKLHDNVVSFFEVVARAKAKLPIIDKELNENLDWKFLFSLKQNEMFVFPSDDFNPKDIDLYNIKNNELISKNLFRVQKFSKVDYGNSSVRDYVFRHHLETELIDKKETRNMTYKVFKSLKGIEEAVKVRINHAGKIVQIGEY
ncbi:type II CRISPR RNA-guided endonuclease Cas9 [Polaribacter sp. M15]